MGSTATPSVKLQARPPKRGKGQIIHMPIPLNPQRQEEPVHVSAQIVDRILIVDHPEAGSDTVR